MNKDVFRFLTKIKDEDVPKDSYGMMLSGYVHDGFGNVYKIPEVGKTPMFSIESLNNTIKFQYNWEDGSLEIYMYDPDTKSTNYLKSYGVSPSDFIDGPEYWAQTAFEELNKDHFQVDEAYNSDSVSFVLIEFGIEQLQGSLNTIGDFCEIINKYHVEENIYDNTFVITAYCNPSGGMLAIKGDVDLLDSEDFTDIFRTFSNHVTNLGLEHKLGKFNVYFEGKW